MPSFGVCSPSDLFTLRGWLDLVVRQDEITLWLKSMFMATIPERRSGFWIRLGRWLTYCTATRRILPEVRSSKLDAVSAPKQ